MAIAWSLVRKVVHPFSKYVESARSKYSSLTVTENKGVRAWSRRLRKYVDPDRPNNMKLKDSQVRWIVRENGRGGLTNAQIAATMGVTVRWVQRLWARHQNHPARDISHPAPMGRPPNGMPGRREHSAVLSARHSEHLGAAALQERIREQTGMNIPHGTIHRILRDERMAEAHPKKGRRRKWVLYERRYSNSM